MNHFSGNQTKDNAFSLVSCLCVTHKKPRLLTRAIACFLSQSYPFKQLVIVYENTDLETELYVKELYLTDNIKLVKADSASVKKTLGELRNMAVREADGEYVCQWDDDDWYHSDRIFYQLQALQKSGKPASILNRWLIFNEVENKVYYSHQRLWEGSIMCRKDIFKLRSYLAVSKGEDTAIIDFLNDNDYLEPLDAPYLYVYIYHSRNTWTIEHFKEIFDSSTEMPKSFSRIMRHVLGGNISAVRRSQYLERAAYLFADTYR
jgi:glycosyltransferase involved in cell wall biosynthesis